MPVTTGRSMHDNEESFLTRWFFVVIHTLRSLWSWLKSCMDNFVWSSSSSSPTITLDSGISVVIGKQIAEGGFSYVFEATDKNNKQRYALKRINIGDNDMMQASKREAQVHRSVQSNNTMPLLGLSFTESPAIGTVCYMLFPYMENSLRKMVHDRVLMLDPGVTQRPLPEVDALELFMGIVLGVEAMHDANYSHCDIKLDNVLLRRSPDRKWIPVLMDFGSVGPLVQPVETRRQVLHLVEQASQHTTLPYRPPELFEGEVRVGDANVDFSKVDVWSLGCTLFAIFFGASPFEMEFRSGKIKIVDCGQLRILGHVPQPLFEMASWCSKDTFTLIQWMLTKDRTMRPSLAQVKSKLQERIKRLGGTLWMEAFEVSSNQDSDLDALIRSV